MFEIRTIKLRRVKKNEHHRSKRFQHLYINNTVPMFCVAKCLLYSVFYCCCTFAPVYNGNIVTVKRICIRVQLASELPNNVHVLSDLLQFIHTWTDAWLDPFLERAARLSDNNQRHFAQHMFNIYLIFTKTSCNSTQT